MGVDYVPGVGENKKWRPNSCEINSWEERSRKNKIKWQHRCENLKSYNIKMVFK
jgi:hypothetical protein